MKLKSVIMLVAFSAATLASGLSCDDSSSVQPPTPEASEYQKRVNKIHENIYKYFYDSNAKLYYETNVPAANDNPHSYLWPLCGLIQAANEKEALNSSGEYMKPVVEAINQYYSAKGPAPGYNSYVAKEKDSDKYYDDNQWIAIAYMDAYNRNGNAMYLNKADEIYTFMMTGHDAKSGGGIYWRENDYSSKNTCSNGPGILTALQLYKVKKEQKYLDAAIKLYEWVNKYLLSPEGVYYDNIKIPSLEIDMTQFTYNTGTMLQSNVLLYEITKEQKYLTEARRVANAANWRFYQGSRFPDDYWFNAVMLRGFIELYKIDKDKNLLKNFIEAADYVWEKEKDKNSLVGRKSAKGLIDQAAMMEIYARLEQLEIE